MTPDQNVSIGDRRLKLTNPDKVLYPATGTTKAEVIGYYVDVAPVLLPHLAGRIVTRKRWPDGVGAEPFFEKNLPASAPKWLRRVQIQHSDHVNTYPVFTSVADLAWAGQVAALELHVPQWRVNRAGKPLNPDRFVLDLDPGPGADLTHCIAVARIAREMLDDMGRPSVPVTSGSKGIHLYAGLDGQADAQQVGRFAKEFAKALEAELPGLAISQMKKELRSGKVFVDWSQNNVNKTTVSPYSLRGRDRPTVAVPRDWDELDDDLEHLTFDQVLRRIEGAPDPLIEVAPPPDRLAEYRSMRDPARTPEPVPGDRPVSTDGNFFVIHEHHARRLHWDLRLEHDGVLVSWALPKGVPTAPDQNHLAVQTEDHPMEYGRFEGVIPKGEYGAGEIWIWDTGRYDVEKWRDDEVIAVLHGRADGGLEKPRRIALIQTDAADKQWLIHLMKDQPR